MTFTLSCTPPAPHPHSHSPSISKNQSQATSGGHSFTRSFTSTLKGNPCLICVDIKDNCRQTPETLNLCISTFGNLPGFRYLGQIKDGLWAKYVIDDGLEPNQQERERHCQEQQQFRQQRATAEAQRHTEVMPHELLGVSLNGLSQVTCQSYASFVKKEEAQALVSQNPLKRLTGANLKRLLDPIKEVIQNT